MVTEVPIILSWLCSHILGSTTNRYIHVTALSSEIIKNLTLAGITPVLCDDRPRHKVDETPSLFLATPEGTSTTRATTVAEATAWAVSEINPLLGACRVVTMSQLTDEFLTQEKFTVVMASRLTPSQASRIAKIVVQAGGKFFLGDSFGMMGCCWMDLGPEHRYRPEKGKELLDPVPLPNYVPIQDMFQAPIQQAINRFHKTPPPPLIYHKAILDWSEQLQRWPQPDEIRTEAELLSAEECQRLAAMANAELVPVCAVLGGEIGNEIIKCISGKGEPANNTLLFDGSLCKCWSFLLQNKN